MLFPSKDKFIQMGCASMVQNGKRFVSVPALLLSIAPAGRVRWGSTGGSGQTGGAQGGAAGDKKQTTLEFWSIVAPGNADYDAYMKAIKKFEDQHPEIKLNITTVSFEVLHDKLVAAINAGNPPDISWGLSEWIGEFSKMDGLADLTEKFNAWSEKDSIYPNVMKGVTVGGKIVAIPHYLGIRALLYHEDMLKQAGLSAPPKTWEEPLAAAPKIKQATGKYAFGIAGSGVRSPQELIAYLASNDLELATPTKDGKYKNTWKDNPDEMKRAAEVFQFYKNLKDKEVMSPDAKAWGYQEEDTNFAQGQYAMVVDGNWMSAHVKENPDTMKDVKVAAPPSGKKPATFMEIAPMFVFKKAKNPEAGWELAKYVMSKDYQGSEYNNYRSPRKDVQRDDMWGKDFTTLANIGIFFPNVSLGGITQAMIDSLQRVLVKNEEPQKAAEWLSDQINQRLKQNGEYGEK
ncbi:sugar ABC transporter substrate-binding protein [Paenibacillus sp. P26]|nr:sugar ABC transporter substrate-binding protein [Paenibacillus sp. P26]